MAKYLDDNGLIYLWSKIKTWVNSVLPTKTSDLQNDSGYITISDVPEGAAASSTTPLMDGTASVGSETAFARGDHRHPSDTNKQDTISDLATIRSGAALGATAVQTETDPIFTASAAHGISSSDISSWNAKGTYSKPSGGIPATDMASAVQTALTAAGNAIPSSQKGAASGVCPLDANSKIDSQYLPSYVDDVIEAYIRSGQTALSQNWLATGSASGTVITPESGKIYVIMNGDTTYPTNSEFRWGGTTYVQMYDGGSTAITNAEIDTITA